MASSNRKKNQTPEPESPSSRRSNGKKRSLIMDTAEKLMLCEGYAAVSTRRVAKESGLKAPLVHYYFPTTDDLFLAVYRRAVENEFEKQQRNQPSPSSLRDLWDTYCNQEQTSLAVEFMALANHRKTIRDEIASLTERTRRQRAEMLSNVIDTRASAMEECSTAGLTVLLIGVARTLVMEQGLGISLGHADASRFIEQWLDQLEKPSK